MAAYHTGNGAKIAGKIARMNVAARGLPRVLFTAAVLTGSFLLFLIQPLFARMVLPLLGRTPSVWNVAMLFWGCAVLADQPDCAVVDKITRGAVGRDLYLLVAPAVQYRDRRGYRRRVYDIRIV